MFEKREIIFRSILFLIAVVIIIIIIMMMDKGIINKNFTFLIPTILILTFLYGFFNSIRYQRSKIFGSKINELLKDIGYELITERTYTIKEIIHNLTIGPTIEINELPTQAYKQISKNSRILIVTNQDDEKFELNVDIIKTWSKKFKLIIKSQRRI